VKEFANRLVRAAVGHPSVKRALERIEDRDLARRAGRWAQQDAAERIATWREAQAEAAAETGARATSLQDVHELAAQAQVGVEAEAEVEPEPGQ
jgi:hypothetical protein